MGGGKGAGMFQKVSRGCFSDALDLCRCFFGCFFFWGEGLSYTLLVLCSGDPMGCQGRTWVPAVLTPSPKDSPGPSGRSAQRAPPLESPPWGDRRVSRVPPRQTRGAQDWGDQLLSVPHLSIRRIY